MFNKPLSFLRNLSAFSTPCSFSGFTPIERSIARKRNEMSQNLHGLHVFNGIIEKILDSLRVNTRRILVKEVVITWTEVVVIYDIIDNNKAGFKEKIREKVETISLNREEKYCILKSIFFALANTFPKSKRLKLKTLDELCSLLSKEKVQIIFRKKDLQIKGDKFISFPESIKRIRNFHLSSPNNRTKIKMRF